MAKQAARSAPVAPPGPNRFLLWLLDSPAAGLVDGALVALTLSGRRTGRTIRLPVQYAVGRDAIWVWPGQPETKMWWRNLRRPASVRVRLLGAEVEGRARVVTKAEPALFQRGQQAYADRFPRAAMALATEAGPLVRIDVPEPALARAAEATVVAGAGLAATIRRHPLGTFFLTAFTLSWGYWIPLALAGGRASHFPGLLGPMVAALLVTAVVAGRAGLADLSRRMLRWRVAPRWYAASLVPIAGAALALLGLAAAGQPLPTWAELGHLPGLPEVGWWGVALLTLLINGYGEETGWRGFAWPRLRQRHTIAGAAGLLAVPWALWHLPTFWLDTGLRGFPLWSLPGFLIGMAAGAVVLGWLYERARASILVVALFHTALNLASATEGTAGVAAAATLPIIIWAVLILRRERRVARPGGPARSGRSAHRKGSLRPSAAGVDGLGRRHGTPLGH